MVIYLYREPEKGPIEAQVHIKACFEAVSEITTGQITTPSGEETTTLSEGTTGAEETTAGTTPSGCVHIAGMADPSVIPSSWISTTEGSDKNYLRPGAAQPWSSEPSPDVIPAIEIRLDEDGDPVEVSEIRFTTVTNVEQVASFVQVIPDGDWIPVTTTDEGFTVSSGFVMRFHGTVAVSAVRLEFTPTDPGSPVSLQIEVDACFEGVSSTTPGGPTTGEPSVGPTEGPTLGPTAGPTEGPTEATTPSVCSEEGMQDPAVMPNDWISSTQGSPVDFLRPGSDQPWQSNTEDESTPAVELFFSEDKEPKEVSEIKFPSLANTEEVIVYVRPGPNDDWMEVVRSSQYGAEPGPGFLVQFQGSVQVSGIKLEFVPLDPLLPVEVRLEVKACFEGAATTAGPTTEPAAVTGVTGEVTFPEESTTPLIETTTVIRCDVDGMADSSLIPTTWIEVSSGNPADLRDGDSATWTSQPDSDSQPEIIIKLVEGPNPLVFVESVSLTELENVASVIVSAFKETDVETYEQPLEVSKHF